MKQLLNNMLQNAMNRYLALDPESVHRLAALEEKIVTLQLNTTPEMLFSIKFQEQKIIVLPEVADNADIIIKGTPLSLMRMSLSQDKRKHFLADNVTIEGNLELGQQVTDLFDRMEIDWEDFLSRWIGDVPAHQLNRVAQNFKDFTRRVSHSLSQNINEYVHEEVDWFPAREALQDFFSDVDQLRMDVDRIEARINKIRRGFE